MNYDRWVKTYRPVRCSNAAPVDGYLFDTNGKELEVVQHACEKDPRCIWTLTAPDCVEHWVIASGWHIVDRMGYLITEVPFVGDFLDVKY